jgi:hypothetical protein
LGYFASSECKQLYNELAAWTVTQDEKEFIHQHLVDAYGAQHIPPNPKLVVPTMTLVGLYLAVERGFTGKQVQKAHMIIAKQTRDWPTFVLPTQRATTTILDVLRVPDNDKPTALLAWCKSVWQLWNHEHVRVADFAKQYLEYV